MTWGPPLEPAWVYAPPYLCEECGVEMGDDADDEARLCGGCRTPLCAWCDDPALDGIEWEGDLVCANHLRIFREAA